MSEIQRREYKKRTCCQTPYHEGHADDCEFVATWKEMPCCITIDGWCFTHSTSAGPVYCEEEA